MARQAAAQSDLYRAREGFAVAVPGDFPRSIPEGTLLRGDDPVVKSHGHLLEPAVEAATAAPGERRTGIRLPSGASLAEVTKNRAAEGDSNMPHRGSLPPEDENSAASPFAPVQPAAGVVADDVPDVQNPAGGPKASEVSAEELNVEEYVETASDPREGAGPVPAGQKDPVTGDEGGHGGPLGTSTGTEEDEGSSSGSKRTAKKASSSKSSGSGK